MICSSLLHDTHTAVLINTAVLILHCRTIYSSPLHDMFFTAVLILHYRTIYQNDTRTLMLGS